MGIYSLEDKQIWEQISFHSIRIPSEWGSIGVQAPVVFKDKEVSIQLGSPASGDLNSQNQVMKEGY